MPTPASRLLEVLELLQSRPVASGREIADHLGVDGRTVRRYIETSRSSGSRSRASAASAAAIASSPATGCRR